MKVTSPLLCDDFVKKATSVASYYGFCPAEKVLGTNGDLKRTRLPLDSHHRRDPFTAEVGAIMHTCAALRRSPPERPLLLYHIGNGRKQQRIFPEQPKRTSWVGLAAVGINGSIAEALVLQTAHTILSELGVKSYRVRVGSIGDRDSAAKFAKEATLFVRKHLDSIPVSLQTAFKRDVFYALESIAQKEHPLHEDMPRPMQFLSDASRRHLREILEYLETSEIPYMVDDTLLGHKDCYTHIIFELLAMPNETEEESVTVARGGRCDELSRRFFRHTTPSVGVVIEGGRPRRKAAVARPSSRKPKVYLVQLGFGAKLQSLLILEKLRKAHIPLYQSLTDNHLNDQLAAAKDMGIPYALIVGQREAIDHTVILRDMATQSQQTVPIDTLPTYLKNIT